MAGLGWKTWSTGDTVSAADFQGYLQDQVIAVFATTSARDTAISSPSDGQFAYVTASTGTLYVYDNSAWTAVDLSGDIQGIVTAATSGLSGGTTSGTATLTLNLAGLTAAQAFGADGAGVDVTFHSGTAGDYLMWDASEEKLIIEGTNGATALDVTDGNVVIGDGTLTVGSDGAGEDVTFYSDTAGDSMVWDSSAEKLTITGTNGQTALDVPDGDVTITDSLTVSGGLIAPLAINAQTGTTYTFVAADAGKLVTSSNGSAQTITVPPNSSVAFAIGTQIIVQNIGSANATLAQGSGVTINSKDSAKEIDGQYAAATLIKTATDAWSLIGALK